jgi:hypothetical protein
LEGFGQLDRSADSGFFATNAGQARVNQETCRINWFRSDSQEGF